MTGPGAKSVILLKFNKKCAISHFYIPKPNISLGKRQHFRIDHFGVILRKNHENTENVRNDRNRGAQTITIRLPETIWQK